ncbi:MAG: transposase zinc-binding domain-containing protein [Sandaracinaceae bacterium]|nr:transposase zinc-binding domain-containing protein [Sandaracinaceae bacterium]
MPARADGYARRRPEDTLLYALVREHWPRFLERAEEQGGLPRFVVRDFDEYLRCGRLEHGVVRLACRRCGHELLVGFACKRRGFCPSCLGRRMSDVASHLVDEVLPEVPIRQWAEPGPAAPAFTAAPRGGLTCGRGTRRRARRERDSHARGAFERMGQWGGLLRARRAVPGCAYRVGPIDPTLAVGGSVARYYPPEESGDEWSSELKVRRAFATLDDDWHVFHSVIWQSLRAGRQGDGEADFVLVHRRHGAIVLEVKGGRVEVTSGQWSSTDRHGEVHSIKNPFEQAKDSKYALLRYLKSLDARLARIPICHGVVFPDGSVGSGIGTYGPRDLIFDRADLTAIAESLGRLVSHWGQSADLDKSTISEVVTALAPTTTIRRALRDQVAATTAAIIELTEQQKRVLATTRRMRRCVILGGAGTGKTVLATERARMLERDGFRTLLLCFNAPLAEALAREVDDEVAEVATFHSFAMRALRAAGAPPPEIERPEWWDGEAATALANVAGTECCPTFDALVIDEGQDFSEDWVTALMLLLSDPDSSPVYLFADAHQQLYGRSTRMPESWPTLILDVNCRNTAPIAMKVAAVFEDHATCLGADGQAPVFVEASSEASQLSVVTQMTYRMLGEGHLRPDQIVVLSDSRTFIDRLRERLAGDEPFVGLNGHGVVAETIHRFKGLEADAIIVVLTESSPDHLLPLAYVGLSRARAMLVVVGRSRLKKKLRWGG